MSGQHIVSPTADQDIRDLVLYVAGFSASSANRLIDRFTQVFERRAQNPLMGRSRDDLRPGLRSFPVERYIIFYRLFGDSGFDV